MLVDRGCYEERFRLTGRAVVGLVVGLVSAGLGVIWDPRGLSADSVILALPAFVAVAAVIVAMPGVIAVARGRVAFRADALGLTLGTVPDNVPAVRRPAEFIPWADVERIVLHLAGPGALGSHAQFRTIAVQRRAGAIPLPLPGTQTRRRVSRPVQVQAQASLTRSITGWQLDRDRLAAVTVAVAPGILIIEVGP
jgi:hypothetical protein